MPSIFDDKQRGRRPISPDPFGTERICAGARSGRRRGVGPHEAFRDAAPAQMRPVPKGSGEIGLLPRCLSSNMLGMSFLLAPNSMPISLGPVARPECPQALE